MSMTGEIVVAVLTDIDIVAARQQGRQLASSLGFHSTDQTLIATAISELARNIIVYAGTGQIAMQPVEESNRRGIMVTASDHGPGIPDVEVAMRDGYSTGNSLGLGLPGTKRLMDTFQILSTFGEGTTVIVKKWL